MFVLAFFKWWYGAGWVLAWQGLVQRLQSIAQAFSVKLLLRTLFSPWRRVTSAQSRGFDGAVHAIIDTSVGRFVGFSVRFVVLVTAGVTSVALIVGGGLLLVVWPFIPPLAIALIITGVLR